MADTIKKQSSKREEFSRIYSDYYPMVFNAIYTKVGNRDDAGDISQEVFLILYEKFEQVESYRNPLQR